ncbi:MAG: tRNA 2-selenouridine(34) synthase MnmH [Pseudomonadota bacterium]
MQTNIDNYTELFVEDIPLIDVRAPIEFQRGAFPAAKNLPIMDDEQRKEVGIFYKKHGQGLAIQKGHELVKGEIREQRIASWVEFYSKSPNAHLYCYRGGLRSKISQQWISDAGKHVPIIHGGYKALRNFLLNELDLATEKYSFKLIGGKTGSAKTILINQLNNGIDLESAAYHRGSTFGRHATEQSTQINFENRLAIDFLKLKIKNIQNVILEDEARTIGRVGIPKSLFEKMRTSPLIVIEEPFEARLKRLLQEYIVDMLNEFLILNSDDPFNKFSNYLLNSLEKIQNRLGPVRHELAHNAMQQALSMHEKSNDLSGHYVWLKIILENYYDPMYEDQLKKREEHIVFRGNYEECKNYLEHTL